MEAAGDEGDGMVSAGSVLPNAVIVEEESIQGGESVVSTIFSFSPPEPTERSFLALVRYF